MPLKIRLQPAVSVENPDTQHIRLFIDSDGLPKLKDSTGNVIDLAAIVGSAGGDLSGSFPNPSVDLTPALKTTGAAVDVSGAAPPSANQVLIATSATAATWQNLPSTPPSGPASGDLVGNYPSPSARRTNGFRTSTTTVDTSGSAAPTVSQVLTAIDGSTGSWQDPPSMNPTGPAGGDLNGTYPNPSVTRARSLKSATTEVVTSGNFPPSGAGYALLATSAVAASWQLPSGDLGGTFSATQVTQARGLKSATTTVDVSSATAPTSGQRLVATSPTTATWQSLDSYVRNPVWDPPLSADAADQEFLIDPFLSGAWQARVAGLNYNTLLARAGDIDVSTQPVNGTYRSTLAGSTVFVQINNSQGALFTRNTQVSGATSGDQTWMAGFGYISEIAPTAGGPFYDLMVLADSGGNPDINNRAFCGTWNPDSQGVSNDFHCGVVSGGSFTQGPQFISNGMGVTGMPGFVIRKGSSQLSGSATAITYGMFSPTGALAASNVQNTSFSGTWSWVGFLAIPNFSNTWGPAAWGGGCIMALHFLRRKLSATGYITG